MLSYIKKKQTKIKYIYERYFKTYKSFQFYYRIRCLRNNKFIIINYNKYMEIFHLCINLGNLKRRFKRNGKLRFTITVQGWTEYVAKFTIKMPQRWCSVHLELLRFQARQLNIMCSNYVTILEYAPVTLLLESLFPQRINAYCKTIGNRLYFLTSSSSS